MAKGQRTEELCHPGLLRPFGIGVYEPLEIIADNLDAVAGGAAWIKIAIIPERCKNHNMAAIGELCRQFWRVVLRYRSKHRRSTSLREYHR